MRRRSTRVYHLGAFEDSICRQKRWERVIDSRLEDLFFTIHCNRQCILSEDANSKVDDVLYISEQVFETMVLYMLLPGADSRILILQVLIFWMQMMIPFG